jgi:hypothetical protein
LSLTKIQTTGRFSSGLGERRRGEDKVESRYAPFIGLMGTSSFVVGIASHFKLKDGEYLRHLLYFSSSLVQITLIHVETVKKNMAQDSGKLEIAIIGAGIAGLATAIALKDHPGIYMRIFEQADRLREIGASIALGPNGMRTLERLGVTNALDDSVAFRNTSGHPMIYRCGIASTNLHARQCLGG